MEPQTAYQQDRVQYVQKIAALFGGYKQRSLEFLQVAPGQTILDVGCGAGDDALAIATKLGPQTTVVGVDSSEDMLASARQRAAALSHVTFQAGTAYALPFEGPTFDRVRADRVFQHLDQPGKALDEMIRVTQPGGWITVLDVDWASLCIDSSDSDFTQAFLRAHYQVHVNGSAGLHLYRQFKESALTDVEVYAETVCVTEWPIANMIWGLEPAAQQIMKAGLLPTETVEAWLKDLQARSEQGTFFGAITGFAARGRKPE